MVVFDDDDDDSYLLLPFASKNVSKKSSQSPPFLVSYAISLLSMFPYLINLSWPLILHLMAEIEPKI